MPPARYPANPNRLTLNLDPITADALAKAASAGKQPRDRLAYELIQRGLGITTTTPIGAASPAIEPEDRMAAALARLNQPPRGST